MRSVSFAICFVIFSLAQVSCGNKMSENKQEDAPAKTMKFQIQPRVDKDGPKSVLILSSSPRRGGNSETLCEQFKRGAEESGNNVEMININDYNIRFFDQKEYDRKASASETDDAAMIIGKMKSADVIVLSSPVYFYNMNAKLKALIDRTYGHEGELKEKEFYYISTSTDRDEEATNDVFNAFHGFARCLYGSVERGIIRGNGVRDRGDINNHPAIQQAYQMGKEV